MEKIKLKVLLVLVIALTINEVNGRNYFKKIGKKIAKATKGAGKNIAKVTKKTGKVIVKETKRTGNNVKKWKDKEEKKLKNSVIKVGKKVGENVVKKEVNKIVENETNQIEKKIIEKPFVQRLSKDNNFIEILKKSKEFQSYYFLYKKNPTKFAENLANKKSGEMIKSYFSEKMGEGSLLEKTKSLVDIYRKGTTPIIAKNKIAKNLKKIEIRKKIIKGFTKNFKKIKDSEICRNNLLILSNMVPKILRHLRETSALEKQRESELTKIQRMIREKKKIISELNFSVKIDKMKEKVFKENNFDKICMKGEFYTLKTSLLKLLLFGDIIKKKDEDKFNEIVVRMMMVYYLGDEEEEVKMGESFADVLNIVMDIDVGVKEEVLKEVDMVNCGVVFSDWVKEMKGMKMMLVFGQLGGVRKKCLKV